MGRQILLMMMRGRLLRGQSRDSRWHHHCHSTWSLSLVMIECGVVVYYICSAHQTISMFGVIQRLIVRCACCRRFPWAEPVSKLWRSRAILLLKGDSAIFWAQSFRFGILNYRSRYAINCRPQLYPRWGYQSSYWLLLLKQLVLGYHLLNFRLVEEIWTQVHSSELVVVIVAIKLCLDGVSSQRQSVLLKLFIFLVLPVFVNILLVEVVLFGRHERSLHFLVP